MMGARSTLCSLLAVATLCLASTGPQAGLAASPPIGQDIVVAQDGSGEFATIGGAVAAASDGDHILVRPGTYRESVAVRKDITIAGDGERDSIVLTYASPPVILLEGSDASLSGFTVRGGRLPAYLEGVQAAVLVRGGAPTLTGLLITNEATELIIADGSTATVRDTIIRDNGMGVVIQGGASPTLKRNEITVVEDDIHGMAGDANRIALAVEDPGTAPVLRDNTVMGTILVLNAAPTLEGNEVTGRTLLHGVDDTTMVRANRFAGGPGDTVAGIWIESSSPTIEANEVRGFTGAAGILVDSSSIDPEHPTDPVVRGNTLRDNETGVRIRDGSAIVESNDISGSGIGILVEGDGTAPFLRHNTLLGNTRDIVVADGATPTLEGNQIGAGPTPSPNPVPMPSGEAALSAAEVAATAAPLVVSDPAAALALYREAWALLARAGATGVPISRTAALETTIRSALDGLYGTQVLDIRVVHPIETGEDPVALTLGPDGAAYVADAATGSVQRVTLKTGRTLTVARVGDGPGTGMTTPRSLSTGGRDVLIVDDRGHLWRWRVPGKNGGGSFRRVRLPGDVAWGDDIIDIGTLLVSLRRHWYNLYAIDPSQDQILRYAPTLDGRDFIGPTPYLALEGEPVRTFRDLYVDQNAYAVTADTVVTYQAGRPLAFALETPPDDGDLRPGHDYRLLAGTGVPERGRLYVYDAIWGRLIAFDKTSGAYIGQWLVPEAGSVSRDVRGMAVLPAAGGKGAMAKSPRLVWVTPGGLYVAPLEGATAAKVALR